MKGVMDKSKNPQSVAFNGIIDLASWWIKHPASHSVVKNNRVELLNDKDPRESLDFFCDVFIGPALEDNISGDEMIEFVDAELKLHEEGKLDYPSLQSLYLLLIALAYYAQAITAEDSQNGFLYVAEGKYWQGYLIGITTENDFALRKSNTKAADASHTEDRQMKAQITEWYYKDGIKLPTKDKAAEEALKIVPMKFSTIRNWLKGL
jgi:hypothetical protein